MKETRKTEDPVEMEVLDWNLLRKGDDKAFARLYEKFSDMLFRYALKFINDEETIKDCIQELFIKLYENRKSLAQTDNVKFFLFRSLKNKLIDHLRKSEPLIYVSPLELQFSADYYLEPDNDDSGNDTEVMEKFESVLNTLNARQKEALYLRYQMGMSYDEIAQLLNINNQSARNLVHRTITKIRKDMDLGLFIILFVKYIL
jgi:RNA polymerase sigma factor (sigma-70 family)